MNHRFRGFDKSCSKLFGLPKTSLQNAQESAAAAAKETPVPTEILYWSSGVTCLIEERKATIRPSPKALEHLMTRVRARSLLAWRLSLIVLCNHRWYGGGCQ